MTKLEYGIIQASIDLIKAMRKENLAMPKSFCAPLTVNAAGILLARLQDAGHVFEPIKEKPKTDFTMDDVPF